MTKQTLLTRRTVLGGACLLLPVPALAASNDATKAAGRRLVALEKTTGARIGLAAIDTGGGNALFWRESERFLMCSTFKVMLVAATLARADAGQEKLDRMIHYRKNDLMEYAPVTTKNLAQGMSVRELCAAAVVYSDNTAANLLFRQIGGPAAVTRFAHSLDDSRTRFDRIEVALNLPDGDKDTTVPTAMLADLRALLLGNALSEASRRQVTDWMIACTTGLTRLRAGLPGWRVGDKTGSGPERGAVAGALNDVAIAWPPHPARAPVLICAYTEGGNSRDPAYDRLLADIGRVVATVFA